jgi:phenylpropionate dioxygenase-like ring-hydroxylating dioxygenase large terminal subunit
MYIKNAWYVAAWSADLATAAPLAITMLDEPLVLYRDDAGRAVALEDRCCHRLAPLSHGRVEGRDIRCLYHGLKFAPDGTCNDMPGHTAIPKAMRVRAYPVAERHSALWVWMGDPARADATQIPDFRGPDHPDWAMLPGRMDYAADYRLIQDNLLDLSHVPYVHRASFGRSDARINDAWTRATVHVAPLAQGVHVTRWLTDTPAQPFLGQPAGARVDVLNAFDYLVPGIFLLTTRHYAQGTAQRSPREAPTEAPLFATFSCQAVTPLTARTTCYFFAYGPWMRHPDAVAMKDGYATLALQAFNEDKTLIEAQQRIIDADPARPMTLFDVDRAPVQYNRLAASLMEQERR